MVELDVHRLDRVGDASLRQRRRAAESIEDPFDRGHQAALSAGEGYKTVDAQLGDDGAADPRLPELRAGDEEPKLAAPGGVAEELADRAAWLIGQVRVDQDDVGVHLDGPFYGRIPVARLYDIVPLRRQSGGDLAAERLVRMGDEKGRHQTSAANKVSVVLDHQ
jgi:hypothetical protein